MYAAFYVRVIECLIIDYFYTFSFSRNPCMCNLCTHELLACVHVTIMTGGRVLIDKEDCKVMLGQVILVIFSR